MGLISDVCHGHGPWDVNAQSARFSPLPCSQHMSMQYMRDKVPRCLSKGYRLRGKKNTFRYDDTYSLRITYLLNYNSVSYCKLFRAHKHHSKISLSQYIKNISIYIQSHLGSNKGNINSVNTS